LSRWRRAILPLHLIHNHNGNCGLCREVVRRSYTASLDGEIASEAAWGDLVGEVLLILSRLLGRDIAEHICADGHL
jgi:hypothetical protein